MPQYAIIGAGQLGSRHLQSLASTESKIWVYDPFEPSLFMAKNRLSEIKLNAEVEFSTGFDSAPKDIDLVVIATNSDVRLDCIKKLVPRSAVKNMILEKVLFNKLGDYVETKNIIETHNISTWVNCPRRAWEIYKQIKALKQPESQVSISVHGGEFGLGSNAIHFLDLISSLIPNEFLKSVNMDAIDSEIIESKRKNFKEITGTLRADFSAGSNINIHFHKNSQAPICMMITFDKIQFCIDEPNKLCRKYENSVMTETSFEIPFQSQLTSKAAESILSFKTCDLTPYSESMGLHVPFIKSFLKFMKKENNEICPIT